VRIHHPMRVDAGVEEEVHRHPARPRAHALVGQRPVEVLRAVGMARIANVVIVFGVAGQREGVVTPAGVLHDLHQRLEVLVVIFGVRPGNGMGMAHRRGVAVTSRGLSRPLSSLRAEKHWKSVHWRPSTSMIWMNSPARTKNDCAVADLTLRSSTGS